MRLGTGASITAALQRWTALDMDKKNMNKKRGLRKGKHSTSFSKNVCFRYCQLFCEALEGKNNEETCSKSAIKTMKHQVQGVGVGLLRFLRYDRLMKLKK